MTIGSQKSPEPSLILERRDDTVLWTAVDQSGQRITLDLTRQAKAGNAAHYASKLYPGVRIGIRSKEFGPETIRAFGDVVWLKEGFTPENFVAKAVRA